MPRKLVTFSDNAPLDRQVGEICRTAVTYRDQVRDALQAGQLEASIQVLIGRLT